MARKFSKTLTVTRTAYKTVEVVDGIPQFVDHHDAVFNGILEKEKVERMLRGQLGKDAIVVVTSIESGQHQYEMDLETFVLNSRIADGEPEDAADSDDGDSADSDEPASNPDSNPVSEAGSALGDLPAVSPTPTPSPAPVPQGDAAEAAPAPQGNAAESAPAPKPDEDDDGVDGVDEPF